jgi:hypothetical protein
MGDVAISGRLAGTTLNNGIETLQRAVVGSDGSQWTLEQSEQAARTAFTTWALGDDITAVTIAAGASSIAADLDCTLVRRDHATIVIVLTGTGTGRVSVSGSRDGVTDLINFGNVLTGLAAGNHFIALTNSLLAYAHHLLVTVTETGGVNSITAKVFLMGRGG